MKAAIREDLEKACRELQVFLAGKSRQDLYDDRGLQLIVEREFEILGEALHRLLQHDEQAFAKITDGRRIIGMRNILAHGYDRYAILFDAYQQNLPLLLQELEDL
jgi:uncharacterized protein with HEPN domain